ncbi:MAG: helix-hairpin-helix domain-containing protein [Candidatus Nanopelagicales bacterium]
MAPVDLNSATADQLETLDGIGPVLAGDIIRWRTDNGRFSSVEDLLDVPGIGEATLAGLREQVVVR